MERFVTYGVRSRPRPAGTQRRLEDLGKVVRLDIGTSALNFRNEDLLRIKTILDAADSSNTELLTQLRKLSVYEIQEENLVQSQLGHSVRRLKQNHGCLEVKKLASNLIGKWRALIKSAKQPPAKQISKEVLGCRGKIQKPTSQPSTVRTAIRPIELRFKQ